MYKKIVVIALGGNAIITADEHGTTSEQFLNVDITARQIVKIIKCGYKVVITHGNGPQAGALLIQQEQSASSVPAQTLAVCGSMTQGQIGWMLQNRILYHLKKEKLDIPVCSIVTQVIVSDTDPDFQDPTKPVGPFYTWKEAEKLKEQNGYLVKEVKPGIERGWRRVVPSPEPIEIVESKSIINLVDNNFIVIAAGGGGIPVKDNGNGNFTGVEAVIDKDRAGFILAQTVNADAFLILTNIEKVSINFNKPAQKYLDYISVQEAEKYYDNGHFLKGSMKPKIQACIRFVKWSKNEAVISSLDKAVDALSGKTGTHIVF